MTVSSYAFMGIAILVLVILFYSLRILREYERGVIFLLGRFWGVKEDGLVRKGAKFGFF